MSLSELRTICYTTIGTLKEFSWIYFHPSPQRLTVASAVHMDSG